jgi:hypothetical protein
VRQQTYIFGLQKTIFGVIIAPLLRHQSPEGDMAHRYGTRTGNTALSQLRGALATGAWPQERTSHAFDFFDFD